MHFFAPVAIVQSLIDMLIIQPKLLQLNISIITDNIIIGEGELSSFYILIMQL